MKKDIIPLMYPAVVCLAFIRSITGIQKPRGVMVMCRPGRKMTIRRNLGYVGIIEIAEVNRGSAWRDTGIAEVEIKE